MTPDEQEPDSPEEKQAEDSANWRGRIGRAVSSSKNVAGSARTAAENAGTSALNVAGNAAEPTRRAAEVAKGVTNAAREKIRRPIDIISLAEFRTEFEQFVQAISTAAIGIHQDQSTLSERLDRLEERLSRLEEAATNGDS